VLYDRGNKGYLTVEEVRLSPQLVHGYDQIGVGMALCRAQSVCLLWLCVYGQFKMFLKDMNSSGFSAENLARADKGICGLVVRPTDRSSVSSIVWCRIFQSYVSTAGRV
jgi:hypothetical protein